MDLKLKGKVALVVASSKGLGRAVARQLAMEGCHIMLTSRNADRLESTRRELLAGAEGQVDAHPCDITRGAEITRLIEVTLERFGQLDILINNAGGPPGGDFAQQDDAAWQAAFELNLLSYIRLIRAALPALRQGGGRIINITSSSVKQPIPGLILSNVYRMGLLGLGKSLAEELAPDNILVNTVAPGRIATERLAYLDQLKADKRNVSRQAIEEESIRSIPLGRYGDPDEFARVVAFLASEANSYMTGSAIMVDGGMVKAY